VSDVVVFTDFASAAEVLSLDTFRDCGYLVRGVECGLFQADNGRGINMRAYGGTPEASKSYFGEPVCETIVAGDINGDCMVNMTDLAILAHNWLRPN